MDGGQHGLTKARGEESFSKELVSGVIRQRTGQKIELRKGFDSERRGF